MTANARALCQGWNRCLSSPDMKPNKDIIYKLKYKKMNKEQNAGTEADKDMQPIVTTSASLAQNPLLAVCTVECEECKGEGEVERNIHRGEEGMQIEMDVMVVCSKCDGTGTTGT